MSSSASTSPSSSSTRPSTNPHAIVLGCGVIGLTTAILLQRYGFTVTIKTRTTPLTAHMDPHYTSNKAGAHWFSFASMNEIRKQALDEIAFQGLSGLAVTEPNSGVAFIRGHALFETQPSQHLALPWWHKLVPRFQIWTQEELAAHSKKVGVNYVYGFSYDALMIHGPHYLNFLYQTFIRAGGEIQLCEVVHLKQCWDGSNAQSPDIVVNCCGPDAGRLGGVEDRTCYPDRGQILIVRAPTITDIWRAPGPDATYVLPRGDGTVVLGGTHDRRGDVLHDPAIAEAIVARCSRLVPSLRDPSTYCLVAHSIGLRPERESHEQRIEIDHEWSASEVDTRTGQQRLVLHAYGHGGEGFQSSWGTAVVLLELIRQARPAFFYPPTSSLPTFHAMHSQFRTDVLQRAGIKPIQAKL